MFSLWNEYLSPETKKIGMELYEKAANERAKGKEIYPSQNQIFRALELTSPESVKVVIIGQDPYYADSRQANGLAFSVSEGVKIPPSLKNIFKEIRNEYHSDVVRENGNLEDWAKQGVLLLNTALTVQAGSPNSHKSWGWDKFVTGVLTACMNLPQTVIFMLWGGNARAFTAGLLLSQQKNKYTLFSSHPSPLGATQGNEAVPAFLGSGQFLAANALLEAKGVEKVKWM